MINFNKLENPYLIGEIGINHNGDINIAKKLIDACYSCGWNSAKFQKRNPKFAVPEDQKNQPKDTPWGRMTYLEYKYKIEFEKTEYDYIDKYCADKPLDWSASIWDLSSLEFMLNYPVQYLKIPSAKLTDEELLTESAKSNNQLIVSTGMSTLSEVDKAVNLLEKHAKSYALLHSNSSYPALDNELNLNTIPFYKDRYNCVVGYSGHEYGLIPSVIAASMGAKIIERHVTLSHSMWGTDQSSSLEITGMDMLKKRLNDIHKMVGLHDKILFDSELPNRKKLRGL